MFVSSAVNAARIAALGKSVVAGLGGAKVAMLLA
jgi:hypothetical protein